MANLDDLTMQTAVRLEGVKSFLSEEMRMRLMVLRQKLKALLDTDDELASMKRRELEAFMREVESVLLAGFERASDGLKASLYELSAVLLAHEAAALVALGVSVTPVSDKLVRAILDSRPLSVEGINTDPLLEPFIDGFSDGQRAKITAALKQGIAQGQTNAQIRQRIIGTKKAGYADGIVGGSIRSGEAVVRTATAHVSSMVRQATAEENRDIVDGFRFLATLDSRTSTVCRSMDSKVLPIDTGVRPPLHINCRSTLVLKLRPQYKGREVGGGRASKDGAVSDKLTYYEWLKAQPEAFQVEVLGVERAKLFRDGGLSASEFSALQLDKQFRPRTLEDLRKLVPGAFRKAGL
ncbi:phage head morphogenesis protein [Neisseria weixii]|uniref:Phage head morphogenesis protein n=1 Tax=Neisseria weixii TaxID=1853276 RepID=A0A3N4NBD4_9NEIS|nr:minor capsid protein [Neisseria weixii]RPD86280.1 phage head morphogenesis protein [Neisseria weixii]RPD89400.1 phage head morphogenesis protein [Neisseria weixii]